MGPILHAHWEPVDRPPPEFTDEELIESEREYQEWVATSEGQEVVAELDAERKAKEANPDRLSRRVDTVDMPMLFARAVQAIWDETGQPCRLYEAGERAGMDNDEYIVAGALAKVSGLVRHPRHPDDPTLEAVNYFVPGVG
jgi:hypothetical protein